MNLFTNFLDVWPTYKNSDKTVHFGDRVTLVSNGLEVTGTLDEISFHVSDDLGDFLVEMTAVVIDEHGDSCEMHDPYFYQEEDDE